MALKFASEAERQEVVARHADLYQRARRGELDAETMTSLSQKMLRPYRKRKGKAQKEPVSAPDEQD